MDIMELLPLKTHLTGSYSTDRKFVDGQCKKICRAVKLLSKTDLNSGSN